jgi:phenylalanine-4-hydroxylase
VRYALEVLSKGQSPLVPAHLRRYVVEQDYGQYTEVDHAVWRFVLLQTHTRLQHTAHAAYRTGLAATGISVDRIPRIDEMNDKLARFGWGAVCVDGFIPPRAFQGFQANRLLPIAAEIRSAEHLTYTPAPDIIHEAAGHAPILSEPAYARFIQEIGAISEKAFASPADRAVYETIHALSEIKENTQSTPAQVKAAEDLLARTLAEVNEVSEAARMARLYWWTSEYGLVGTAQDYALYGAGLLSSLGESQSCHASTVRKLPLSRACVDYDYDITRVQPQLFVAENFEQLSSVLAEVSATLAYRGPALPALALAQRSREVATLALEGDLELAGIVTDFASFEDEPSWVQLAGAPGLFLAHAPKGALRVSDGHLPPCPAGYVLPLGRLADGRPLSGLSREALRDCMSRSAPSGARAERGELLRLELRSGARVSGVLRELHEHEGYVSSVVLEHLELRQPDGRVFRSQSPYPLPLSEHILSVQAGAPGAYFGSSELSRTRVPAPRWFTPRERDLLSLYERAVEAWRGMAG